LHIFIQEKTQMEMQVQHCKEQTCKVFPAFSWLPKWCEGPDCTP